MEQEFSRELPVELSDDEVAERSDRMARALAEHDASQAEADKVRKRYKREMEALDAEVRLLADIVRQRREVRDVPCKTITERDGTVTVVRLDTGEVIQRTKAGPGTQLPLRERDEGED